MSQAAVISNHPHIFHVAWTTVTVTLVFQEQLYCSSCAVAVDSRRLGSGFPASK